MRLLAAAVAAAVAVPAAGDQLPPPPSDPWRGAWTPREESGARGGAARRPRTIGEAPVAPAGSQAAPLPPDEGLSSWRFSLATGVTGKSGGMRIANERENPAVLLYFGAQADGLWGEGRGRAARLRLRLFTGGERGIYVPSDGDAEAAYMLGRRELQFVVGRVEVGRYPALGIATLAQFATLPCFEGTVSLAGDAMRLHYHLAPVEGVWVYYRGAAHIPHRAGWATESDRPSAASAARLRYTALLPPALLLSIQGDVMKTWREPDLLLAAEGSLGYPLLQQSAAFDVVVRWNRYTRRGRARDTSDAESELMLLGIASLVL